MTRMPFGKYRGRPVEDVPAGYLAWLLEETDVREPHRSAIRDELAWRLDLVPDSALQLAPPPAIAEIVSAGYRALASRLHPDHGGATCHMQQLNSARDWCRATGLLR